MSWEKGCQEYRLDYQAREFNNSLLEEESFLEQEDAKVKLYKFLRKNPGFASQLLLGVRLFPFQYLAIKSMCISDYSMFVLSRGMSKTFSCAVYCLLEAILNQGVQIGVISASFRQSKLIMQKMEDILNKPSSRLAQDAIGGDKKRLIKKGTDQWELIVGKSRVVALPLANGERLRGFRFTQIVLDEFLTIPEKIFNEVILPFLGVIPNPTEREDLDNLENALIAAGKMKKDEKYVWPNNKLILLSSPSFKFEYMYKLYKQYVELIMQKPDSEKEEILGEQEETELIGDAGAYRLVMQLAYDCAPKQLYDQNLLKQAKATMSEMQFKREFGAQFVDESDGYFRLSKMAACSIEPGTDDNLSVEVIGNPKDEYILAFDPNWAGNTSADHFAMQLFKVLKNEQKLCLVHSYAIAGVDLKMHMRYFHYILTHFNIVGICGDYNGGVQFIEACNESSLFKDSNINIGVLDVKLDDPTTYNEEIQELKNMYNIGKRKYCILRKPSSNWIREANELLQAAIDHKRILFGSRALDEHFDNQRKANIPIGDLKWNIQESKSSKQAQMIDFIDCLADNIELTKNECANIEVKSNPQGSQTFDLPQHLKRQTGPFRARKDSYSALVLGNWFGKIYFDQLFMEKQKEVVSTFTPMLIT